jgi:hypothetical protein
MQSHNILDFVFNWLTSGINSFKMESKPRIRSMISLQMLKKANIMPEESFIRDQEQARPQPRSGSRDTLNIIPTCETASILYVQ